MKKMRCAVCQGTDFTLVSALHILYACKRCGTVRVA